MVEKQISFGDDRKKSKGSGKDRRASVTPTFPASAAVKMGHPRFSWVTERKAKATATADSPVGNDRQKCKGKGKERRASVTPTFPASAAVKMGHPQFSWVTERKATATADFPEGNDRQKCKCKGKDRRASVTPTFPASAAVKMGHPRFSWVTERKAKATATADSPKGNDRQKCKGNCKGKSKS